MVATAISPLLSLAPPTPEPEMGDLPMSLWANLPFIVCGVFAIVTMIGLIFIVRENRRIAERSLFTEPKKPQPPTDQG